MLLIAFLLIFATHLGDFMLFTSLEVFNILQKDYDL